MLNRRSFAAATAFVSTSLVRGMAQRFNALSAHLAALERENGGRLGVAVMDTASGERAGYRVDERFPMCSTFKFLLAAAVLRRVDRRREALDRTVRIPPKPLLSNSPLTEPNARGTMTVASLCHAALTRSDNTAANLLLETIGGPAAISRFARSLGDRVTRLDRMELALNECLAGDPRDTTSPNAIAVDLRSVLLGGVLSTASREQMMRWMEANITGLERLRAKLPAGWRAADKTGSNGSHTSNDIAVLWPPERPPIVIAAYITQCAGPESKRAAMLAAIGGLVRKSLG